VCYNDGIAAAITFPHCPRVRRRGHLLACQPEASGYTLMDVYGGFFRDQVGPWLLRVPLRLRLPLDAQNGQHIDFCPFCSIILMPTKRSVHQLIKVLSCPACQLGILILSLLTSQTCIPISNDYSMYFRS